LKYIRIWRAEKFIRKRFCFAGFFIDHPFLYHFGGTSDNGFIPNRATFCNYITLEMKVVFWY